MHKAIWRIDRGVEHHTVGAQNSEVENRSKPQCTAIGATVRRALNPSYENPTQPTRDHQWKTEPKLVDPSTKTPSRNPTMTPYPPSQDKETNIMKQAPSSSTTHSTENFGSTPEALDLNRNEGSCPAKPVPRLQKNTKKSGDTRSGGSDDRTIRRKMRQSKEQGTRPYF
ncbi:hypothetical protein DY000_02032862 [Brassica cretica]|uniref:DUF4005 domain-containing protein n=1 Tax=Brassica cretica TaxID=69181 RepID=A0ABQ7DRV8_BRACR|nr:hypothetical protein DY000_02032862 [Brassica cretica]